MTPHSPEWEAAANRLARSYAPTIYPCAKCGAPVMRGYCCTYCGDCNPSEPPKEKKEP